MFKPSTANSVDEYIQMIEEPRKSDVVRLHALIQKIAPKLEVKMWNSVIGYGEYHYKSASGREGDWFVIGLASQKNYISLYVSSNDENMYLAEKYKERFPKASVGRSCVRFKKLDNVDLKSLEELIKKGSAFSIA